MAIDGYMAFRFTDNSFLQSESQVDVSGDKSPLATDPTGAISLADAAAKKDGRMGLFEIEDFSFDIEQTLNIGSQSTGAGAGRVTFNPFSITRKVDMASPKLFEMSCSGTPFKFVTLWLRKAAGGGATGSVYLRFDFKLVAVKTMAWSFDDGSPKEIVTFEYGGLQLRYSPQSPNGGMAAPTVGGWNRVKNTRDQANLPI